MSAQANTDVGTGYLLVHHAMSPAFAPLRIMNAVTYLGRQGGNDIVLDSRNVSRRHAKLIVTDLGVTVHDLDSHNGIFLNGKKVRSTPVSAGDLLYVGDVCLRLTLPDGPSTADVGQETNVVHLDISDEDDPPARALAAMLRITSLCIDGDEAIWAGEAIQVCRELVEATVAAYVDIDAHGDLDAPVVLRPDASQAGRNAVHWSLVQKVIAERKPLLSSDVVADGHIDRLEDGDLQAVMVAPVAIHPNDPPRAVIYLARAQATSGFSDLEFETLQHIARLVALRLERHDDSNEVTHAGDRDDLATQLRVATLEEQLSSEMQESTRLAEQLATAKAALAEAESKLAKGSDDDDSATRRERDEARRERDEARRERDKSQREREDLQGDLETLRAEYDMSLKKAEGQAAEIVDLLGRVESQGAELSKTASRQQAAAEAAEAADVAIAAAHTERDDLQKKLDALSAELAERRSAEERLTQAVADLERHQAEAEATQEAAIKARGDEVKALRDAMRQSVLPAIADHVEARASGDNARGDAATRQIAAVYVALADFDAWCAAADAADVKGRLNRFCDVVEKATKQYGGRIEQIIGHGHLLSFDEAKLRDAVGCALSISATIDGEGGPPVVAGIDVGTSVAGFFGSDEAVVFVEAGVPVVVACAAVEYAPKGVDGPHGVVVADGVRNALARDEAFSFTRLEKTWIHGVNAPVQLALVERDPDAPSDFPDGGDGASQMAGDDGESGSDGNNGGAS